MKQVQVAPIRADLRISEGELRRLMSRPAPAVSSQERYKDLLARYIAPYMRSRGFKRRRNSWGRQTPDGWMVVDFQASSFGDRHELDFTINLGVFSHAVARALREQPRPSLPPPESLCHYRNRIGSLIKDGRDQWWKIPADKPVDSLAKGVLRVLRDLAVPHVESMPSDEAMLEWMLKPKVLEVQMPRVVLVLMKQLRPASALREYGTELWKQSPVWTVGVWKELRLPRALLPVASTSRGPKH